MVQKDNQNNDGDVKTNLIGHTDGETRQTPNTDNKPGLSKEDLEGKVDYEMSIGSYTDLTEGVLTDDRDERKPSEKPTVPDGGYGWFVVLGCFLSHVIVGGFERNDGVYYLQFKARFNESAQLTSWPGALVSTLRLFLGPVASAVCSMYSVRTTTIIGAIILTLAQILNAFTPNFYFLFFSHSALQGVGRGLMYAPSLIIISMYFDKHQGLAAGLGSSGVGVGTFCLVPFTQFLFDTYGFQGTFIIMAGIALNGMLVAMLYRPLSMHRRFTQETRITDTDQLEVEQEVVLAQLAEAGDSTSIQSIRLHRKSVSVSEKEDSRALTHLTSTGPVPEQKQSEGWCLSSLKICFPVEHQGKAGSNKKKLFHFGLLKDPSFLMFCVSIGLFTAAFKAAFTFIPALVKSKNLSESDAAMVLSICGIFDTLGRIVSGLILDRPLLRPHRLLLYNSFVFAIATVSFILPFLKSFATLSVMCSFYGALTGAYISQKSVVLVDILGIENMSSSFGLLICFQAMGMCAGPPLSGALRDAFGGFDEAFYLGGCFMVLAGLLMIASNIFLTIKNRRHRSHQKPAKLPETEAQ
ncbi:unnamed protein product [Candidula unifasciata]|uniref:Major facilitator superfamily (MFS) profile domain-containing protein n=1 Tax=Candidula unifasciata TaxID=100452 RepID=A0A8S3ZC40_9EUPU|nr:unnamed protein product [Candidula unifasciata]